MPSSFARVAALAMLLGAAQGGVMQDCGDCSRFAHAFLMGMKDSRSVPLKAGQVDWLEADLVERKSESRLVEIMDGICPPRDYRCQQFMETNEELIETWWRQRDGSEVDEDLRKHMCENKLRLCCPYPHWGPECKQCPGTKTSPCTGRGHCNGLATRGGNGTCTCEGDYGGEDCSDCKPAMFVNWTDPAGDNFTCANCSTSCASCTGPAETECTECASGYTQQGNLCVDVDECTLEENPHTCPTGTWCRNIPGSVACTVCDHACNFTLGCSGPGPRACVECRDRHRRHDNGSCAEINNCHDGHDCPVGEYCVHQGPAVHHCKPCHVSCSLEGGCNGGGPKNCTGGCAKGYAMHDGNLCFDVNECHDFPCAFPEVCVNKPGGYDCKCAKGYHRGRDGEHPECIKKTEDDHAHYAKKDEEAKKELEKLIEQRQAEGAKKFKENEKLYNKHIKEMRKKFAKENPNWKMPRHEDL